VSGIAVGDGSTAGAVQLTIAMVSNNGPHVIHLALVILALLLVWPGKALNVAGRSS
jgi:hypothetical protein